MVGVEQGEGKHGAEGPEEGDHEFGGAPVASDVALLHVVRAIDEAGDDTGGKFASEDEKSTEYDGGIGPLGDSTQDPWNDTDSGDDGKDGHQGKGEMCGNSGGESECDEENGVGQYGNQSSYGADVPCGDVAWQAAGAVEFSHEPGVHDAEVKAGNICGCRGHEYGDG